jgi:hypothetical protein
MQGLAPVFRGAGTPDAAGHELASRCVHGRGKDGQPIAPDQGDSDRVLAEPTVLGVRAVATACDVSVLDPDFGGVGFRSGDLGVQGRFGHRVLI